MQPDNVYSRTRFARPWGLLAAALGLLALFGARLTPSLVDSLYSKGVYPPMARAVSYVFGLVPWAAAEIVYVVLFGLAVIVAAKRSRIGGSKKRRAGAFVLAFLSFAGWVLVVQLGLYGFNYARSGPEKVFGLHLVDPARAEEIIADVGKRVDDLRSRLQEDRAGVVVTDRNLKSLDQDLDLAQGKVLQSVKLPAIANGRTKPLFISFVWRRYFTGVFSPVTFEPTITTPGYPAIFPSTVAHERAHLSGFAGEDEASFIGILTTWSSNRPDVRYAGWLDLYLEFGQGTKDRTPGVQRDHAAIAEYFRRTTGPESKVVTKAQDLALKGVGETQGVKSYRRVAALALSWIDRYGMPPDPAL